MEKSTCVAIIFATVLFFGCLEALAEAQNEISRIKTAIEWVSAEVHASGLQIRIFESTIVKSQVSYHIYLPEEYKSDKTRHFPVQYWLHGAEQDHQAGGGRGSAMLSKHFSNAMREGKIPPMIIVFPNGLRKGMWCDSKDGKTPIESLLIKELIPEIDTQFRTIATREGRMIAGHSMGGYGATRLAFKYPHVFCAVSFRGAGPLQQVFKPTIGPKGNTTTRARLLKTVYGGDQSYFKQLSPWILAEQNAEQLRENTHIRQLIGEKDFTLPANLEFHAHLTRLKIPHIFNVLPGIEHDALQLINVLCNDEEYWKFYRTVFNPAKHLDESKHKDCAQQDTTSNPEIHTTVKGSTCEF